jgi:TRAP-type C4-dicarboxylate transport system permease small subunit
VTKNQATLAWIASLALLAIAAGMNWQSFEVSMSAGGGLIEISGFLAFPIIGTLVLLQVLTLLIGLLVKPLVTRVLAGVMLPLMVWNFSDVLLNSTTRVQETLVGVLAKQTGVIEQIGDSEFLASSSIGISSSLFLVALAVNCLLLAFFLLRPAIRNRAKARKGGQQQPEDLWSSQN